MWVREWFKMGDAVACYMLIRMMQKRKTDNTGERGDDYEQTF